ncbi:hypothetical protein BAC2_01369 [uncultured bacterium]|nr:hypothetical protein BAC2_01369 [uncultured bacterium]
MIRRCLTLLALVVLSSALGRAGLAADPPGVRFRTIDEGFAEARARRLIGMGRGQGAHRKLLAAELTSS